MELGMPLHAEYVRPPFEANGFDNAVRRTARLDAQTLEEVKRLPMRKPVGKYNVWNKITREEGTSH